MAGKHLSYTIRWIQKDGVQKAEIIDIAMVSEYIKREYAAIMGKALQVRAWYEEVKNTDDSELKKELEAKISDIYSSDFMDKRFDLVIELLIKNGVKQDSPLLTRDFWDREVDSNTIYDLLTQAINKDNEAIAESKKKLQSESLAQTKID
jgi:hypothetical protein